MCGFAGIHRLDGAEVDRGRLAAMSGAVRHRGPDGDGELRLPGLGLCHRRLAVIDPSERSAQPMADDATGSCLVFNGEIYNFKPLRAELEARGERFLSDGDSEVLLRGLVRHGEAFVPRLDGDFAFAFWDAPRRRLLLGRDRFGVKPLYYCLRGGELLFASEIRALLAAGVPAEAHLPAVVEALRWRYARGAHTAFSGVLRLPPAHLLTVGEGGAQLSRYWTLAPSGHGSLEDGLEALHQAFVDSVKLRLQADVEVGLLLSAGVDSTSIASALRRATAAPLHAFTYQIPGALSEVEAAGRLAKQLGFEHHVVEHVPEHLDSLRQIVAAVEEPYGDSIIVPNFYLMRDCRRHVKVVLSGEGADEVFGGYGHQRVLQKLFWLDEHGFGPLRRAAAPLVRRLPMGLLNRLSPYPAALDDSARDRLAGLCETTSPIQAYRLTATLFTDAELQRLLAPEVWRARDDQLAFAPAPPWEQVLRADIADWLPNYGLLRTDKLSMAHGLECRVPFLSHHVVEVALELTLRMRQSAWSRDKPPLRKMARARLPGAAFARKKHPFFLPTEVAYGDRLERMLEETLGGAAVERHGLLDAGAVRALLARRSADFLSHKKLIALLHFQLWCDAFLSGVRS